MAGCQKEPTIIDAFPTATAEPVMSEVPIASIEPSATEAVMPTEEATAAIVPTATSTSTAAAVTPTPQAGKTGMLDNAPEFKTSGKLIDSVNTEELGTLQVEDVTKQEVDDYVAALLAAGYEGELDKEADVEMYYGCFTNESYAINITYTAESGMTKEFLLCITVNE